MLRIDHASVPDTARLLVGFSGGCDSTALLHTLNTHFPGRLRALHVHHGLHADADDWARHCGNVTAGWGVPLRIIHVDAKAGVPTQGLEGAARTARYAAFAEAMQPDDILCTAHHQDDQAETLLLRLMRGSGVDGLSAMREWRDFGAHRHWRPLLHTPRSELEAYCTAQGLQVIDDPSNHSEIHERNFLRHRVLPLLRERWPQAARSLSHSAGLLARDADWLSDESTKLLAHCQGLGDDTLHVPALQALNPAQRAHVLRRWMLELGAASLDSHALAAIERELLNTRADAEASLRWRGHVIHRWRDLLHLEPLREAWPEAWAVRWDAAHPLTLPCGRRLTLRHADDASPFFDVRARRGGERLQQAGRAHRQEVRKLFQQAAIPPWERERLPMILRDDELIAVGDVLRSRTAAERGWWFSLRDA